jgi:hypothetical protein
VTRAEQLPEPLPLKLKDVERKFIAIIDAEILCLRRMKNCRSTITLGTRYTASFHEFERYRAPERASHTLLTSVMRTTCNSFQ